MSKKKEAIRQKISELASRGGPKVSMLAQVRSVDKIDLSCVLYEEEIEYYDVRLCPVLDGKTGVVLYPKVDTWVLAVRIEDDDDWFIVGCEEVDSVEVNVGAITVLVNAEGVFLNGSSLGGLVKVNELVNDLNAIKSDINDLKTIFSSWTPVPQDGGAALKGASAIWAAQQLSSTLKSDLENSKVKHG